VNTCPDYWKLDASNNCIFPLPSDVNTGNLYTKKNSNIVPPYTNWSPFIDSLIKDSNVNGKGYTNVIDNNLNPIFDSNGNVVPHIDFNDPYWLNICQRQSWANSLNLNWDGITNYSVCGKSQFSIIN
jgi:hypothetical protein